MSYLKGEDINLGVGVEEPRGTAVSPTIWIPGRTPTGVKVQVEKTQIRETKGSGMSSQGSVIIQKRSEGDLEFNVRNGSIGYFLLSLLGKVTSAPSGDAYTHTFDILTGNPQYPTLTLALSQLGQQDYEYKKVLVTSFELKTPVDDLVNAKVTFVGVDEAVHADYTPSFPSSDYFFRHYDVTIKIADNVAGLGAASPLKLKEFNLNINNNGRVNQNISELNPGDVLGILHEVSGSMKIDYDGETHHDIYVNNTYKALQITLQRTDIEIGSESPAGDNPKIVITLPKISYTNFTPDRPIDDIVAQGIDYMAHYDESAGYGIRVVVTNEIPAYESES
jgi:hypothetical protein